MTAPEPPAVFLSPGERERVGAAAAAAGTVGVRVLACGGRTLLVRPASTDMAELERAFTHAAHAPPVDLSGDAGPVVLVLGCGGGWVMADLLRRLPRAEVVGVEGTPALASLAERNVGEFGDRARVLRARCGAEDRAAGAGDGTPAVSAGSMVERFGRRAPAAGLDGAGVRVAYVFVDLRGGEMDVIGGDAAWLRSTGCVRVRCAGAGSADRVCAWLAAAGMTVWSNDWGGGPVVTGVSRAFGARVPRYPVPQTEIDPGPGFW